MLPHTLEIEWLLRGRCKEPVCRDLIAEALKDLESFIRRVTYGGMRLIEAPDPGRADEAFQRRHIDMLADFREGFRFFFGEPPEQMIAVSREELRRANRAQQYQHYENLRHGSFSLRAVSHARLQDLRQQLGKTPVAYDGAPRSLTLNRALHTCFNTSGVTGVLKEHLNAAFAKVVENECITIWHARLGLAAFADESSLAPLSALTRSLHDVLPFGAVSAPKWYASYLVS